MSDFPDLDQLRESRQTISSPTTWEPSANGTMLGVARGSQRWRAFNLQIIDNDANWQTIETLYRDRQRPSGTRTLTFTSKQDSVEYTVKFAGRPSRKMIGPDLYRIQVVLREAT